MFDHFSFLFLDFNFHNLTGRLQSGGTKRGAIFLTLIFSIFHIFRRCPCRAGISNFFCLISVFLFHLFHRTFRPGPKKGIATPFWIFGPQQFLWIPGRVKLGHPRQMLHICRGVLSNSSAK